MAFELLQHIIERSKRKNKEELMKSQFYGQVNIKEIYRKTTDLVFSDIKDQNELEGCMDAIKSLGVNLG